MSTMDDMGKDARVRYSGGSIFTTTHQTRAEANARKHGANLFSKTAADAMASDVTAERTCAFRVPAHVLDGIRVTKVTLLPQAACTANGTNFATVTVAANGGSGARTTVATIDTSANSWVAFTAIEMTLQAAANLLVAVGGQFTIAISKAASGVVVPIFDVIVEYEEV